MHVLLTGATGTIGSAVLTALLDRGHDVTASVRSDEKAAAIDAAGGTGVVVDHTDAARLVYLMRESDAVVHTASDPDDPEGFDRRVAQAAIEALSGSAKPYVHTGGVWIYGAGDDLVETDPYDPPALTAWRPGVIALLEDADLPVTVIHPGIVYGPEGQGIASVVTEAPLDAAGRHLLPGDGAQHWTTIHVDDLAALYATVVDAGSGFADVMAVDARNPTVAEIAEAVGGGTPEDPAATRQRLGAPFADALLLDQRASGDKARAIGGWRPTRPGLLDVLRGR